MQTYPNITLPKNNFTLGGFPPTVESVIVIAPCNGLKVKSVPCLEPQVP